MSEVPLYQKLQPITPHGVSERSHTGVTREYGQRERVLY